MMTTTKKTPTTKQLIKFRNQLHNLLIRNPEIRISGDSNGDVCAYITPNEPHSLTECIYLPTNGKQELISK